MLCYFLEQLENIMSGGSKLNERISQGPAGQLGRAGPIGPDGPPGKHVSIIYIHTMISL